MMGTKQTLCGAVLAAALACAGAWGRGACFPLSHRGGSAENDENTVEAFRTCVAKGHRAFETDVKITRDGALVIIHDDTVDRTTDGTGKVCAMTLDEIRAVRTKKTGARVPTFDEFLDVMATCSNAYVQIELKSRAKECPGGDLAAYCRKVDAAARKRLRPDAELSYSSFDYKALAAMRTVNADVPLVWLTKACGEAEIAKVKALGGTARISARVGSVTAADVKAANAAGVRVGGWGAGASLDRYRAALACGFDYVTTDIPSAVLDWRAKHLP